MASSRPTSKTRRQLHLLLRYGVAVLAAVAAWALVLIPVIGRSFASVLFFAVLVSAWFGGMRPGLLTTALLVILSLSTMMIRLRNGDPILWPRLISVGLFSV